MNYFLKTGGKVFPKAPESSFWHLGSGVNMIYCDLKNNMVIVARWISREDREGIVNRVLAAME